MELWIDGTLFDTIQTNGASSLLEVTAGSDYRARFTGAHTLANGTNNAKMVLRVTAEQNSDRSTTNGITTTLNASAIRYQDTNGLSHEDPNSGTITRDFDFKVLTTGSIDTFLDANSPSHRNVVITTSGETPAVELLRFQLEAEQQGIGIDTLEFDIQSDGNAGAAQLFADIYLADANGNLIQSATTIATQTLFSSMDPDLAIAKDDKVTYRLMANIADADDVTNGSSASTTLDISGTTAEDEEFTSITSFTGGDITSNDVHFYTAGPTFSNLSVTTVGVENTPYLVNHTFKFTVTATGGDIYISDTPATAFATATTASSTGFVIADVSASPSSALDSSDTHWGVTAGSSRTFTLSGSTDNNNGTAGTYKSEITKIYWDDDTTGLQEAFDDFNLEDLEALFTVTAS